jgi:hypothetical protein
MLTKEDIKALLDRLCLELGFCLPSVRDVIRKLYTNC